LENRGVALCPSVKQRIDSAFRRYRFEAAAFHSDFIGLRVNLTNLGIPKENANFAVAVANYAISLG